MTVMLQLRVVYGVLPWKKLLCLKTNKQKTEPTLLPSKNTTKGNSKQNVSDAPIWPRVVFLDFTDRIK